MKKIVAICVSALLMAGCKKSTLELTNPNVITTQTFWRNEGDVIASLSATYNLLRNMDNGYWGASGRQLSNGRGDDIFIRNDVADRYTVSIFTNTADNGKVNGLWRLMYQGIYRTNQIIEKVPGVTMDEAKKKEYIAEATFLRGLNYFNLAVNFGDVPLHLSTPKSTADYFVPKSPEDSVYIQIIKDFTAAAEGLPVSYPAQWVGRATKGAALGMLGKAYLYQKKYAEAEAAFKKVTEAPFAYDLMTNFADNFDLRFENNKESVFTIQFQDVGGLYTHSTGAAENIGSRAAQSFAPEQVSGWFAMFPTNKLYDEFQKEKTVNNMNDPRFDATLVWQGEQGTFYQRPIADFFPTPFGFKARLKKYQNWQQKDESTGIKGGVYSSSINEDVLRFDDVLLMYAEAATMQARPQDAYAAVNRIRRRAQLADLTPGYSQDQMMAEIRHQRLIEFVREGNRFYDLRRWNLIPQELATSDKLGKEFFSPSKHLYFPIPQAELEANPNMVQRTGW